MSRKRTKERSYRAEIMAELSDQERAAAFLIIRKYNWINQKLERGERLRQVEDDFIIDKPHSVNKWLDIDWIGDQIYFIDNREVKSGEEEGI